MDPILSKLINLWELDESTLNNHSLPANSQFFFSSHSLKCDEVSPRRKVSNTVIHASTNSSERGQPFSQLNFCEQCNYPNQDCANWCIECGKAIERSRTPSEKLQGGSDCSSSNNFSRELLNNHVDQKSASKFPDCDYRLSPTCRYSQPDVNPHIDSSPCPSDNHHFLSDSIATDENQHTCFVQQLSPKSPNRFTPTSTSKPSHVNTPNDSDAVNSSTNSSLLITKRDYHRHWNTCSSSVYMWRKPSSIQKRNHLRFTTNLSDSVNLPIVHRKSDNKLSLPVLDLSAIQSDCISSSGESTSTISSCTDRVRTTSLC